MSKIFEPNIINKMKLKNRIFRSATWEGMCDSSGKPTQKLIDYYKKLAQGDIGLIITGFTYVNPLGKQLPGKMGIYDDSFASEMKQLVKAVHDENGKVCIQLVHAGGQTDSKNAGAQPVAPSSIKVDQFPETPHELTIDEIKNIINDFANASKRAKDYGFDAIQLHGAHGYLINQFLSPITNKRNDEYGGDINGRSKFLMDIYKEIRGKIGDDFPFLIKLTASDNLDNGFNIQDALIVAKKLEEAGIDAIEVSSGTPASGNFGPVRSRISKIENEAYNLDYGKIFKKEVKCPIISVGGFRTFELIRNVIKDHNVDYVSI